MSILEDGFSSESPSLSNSLRSLPHLPKRLDPPVPSFVNQRLRFSPAVEQPKDTIPHRLHNPRPLTHGRTHRHVQNVELLDKDEVGRDAFGLLRGAAGEADQEHAGVRGSAFKGGFHLADDVVCNPSEARR